MYSLLLDNDNNLLPFSHVIILLKGNNGLNVKIFVIAFILCTLTAELSYSGYYHNQAWLYVDYAMEYHNLHTALMLTSPYYIETYVKLINLKYITSNYYLW